MMSSTSHEKKRMTSPSSSFSSLLIASFVLFHLLARVSGHGRLVEPPSRSSMWRFGFKTEPNYNDNELFCGGYTVHFQRNGGKCGVCGDAWNAPSPRPNEAGGKYGKGIIVRTYKPGEFIKSTVDITANHKGFFEFKLCPHNNPKTIVHQDCLDNYPLSLADGSGTKYYPHAGTGYFDVQLRLPDHVTCSQCVFQWTYTAGNNWGNCGNGTSKVGCGPQETFRGCADVAIEDKRSNDIPTYAGRPISYGPSISAIPPRKTPPRARPRPTRPNRYRPTSRTHYYNNRMTAPTSTTRRPLPTRWRPTPTRRRPIPTRKRPVQTTPAYNYPNRRYTTRRPIRPSPYRPTNTKKTTTKKPRPTFKPKVSPKAPSGGTGRSCRGVGAWSTIPNIATWCESNCGRGFCPPSHCQCN